MRSVRLRPGDGNLSPLAKVSATKPPLSLCNYCRMGRDREDLQIVCFSSWTFYALIPIREPYL